MKHLFPRFLALLAVAFLAVAPPARATDLSITTTSFLPGANADKIIGTAGAAITIGQLLYFDSGSLSYKLADANLSVATAQVVGIAGSAAASGQPVIVIREDSDLTLGATLSMAAPFYVVSATAGGVAPSADIVAGWYPSAVIVAKSTTKCVFKAGALRGPAVTVDVFNFRSLGNFPRLAGMPLPHQKQLAWREEDIALAA